MIHRLFTFASALSLLLFLATTVLWVRSRFADDWREVTYGFGTPGRPREIAFQVDSCRDGLDIFVSSEATSDPEESFRLDPSGWESSGYFGMPASESFSPLPRRSCLGLKVYRKTTNSALTRALLFTALLPHWLLVFGSAALPASMFVRRRRRIRRRQMGRCPTCNYDLRASVDRCPECGTPMPMCTDV